MSWDCCLWQPPIQRQNRWLICRKRGEIPMRSTPALRYAPRAAGRGRATLGRMSTADSHSFTGALAPIDAVCSSSGGNPQMDI
jgi:hypothetical protein